MIGIIGAMDIEVIQLKEQIENVVVETISGVDFYKGTLQGKDVVVAVSGIGKVNAAVCTQTMILTYKPSMIIRNSGRNYVLRASIPIYKGNIACEFFNINRELVSSTYLSPNDDVICIIEISNMKFYNKSFVCEWEVKKMKILKNLIQNCFGYTNS